MIYFLMSDQQILPMSNAFHRGLSDVISPSWLRLFNASEFNQVTGVLSFFTQFHCRNTGLQNLRLLYFAVAFRRKSRY